MIQRLEIFYYQTRRHMTYLKNFSSAEVVLVENKSEGRSLQSLAREGRKKTFCPLPEVIPCQYE